MSKKKNKKISVGKITTQQQFDNQKPRYNGYQCGTGVHGDISYNRNKSKEEARRIINESW